MSDHGAHLHRAAKALRDRPVLDETAVGLVADLLEQIGLEYDAATPCGDGCPNRGLETWSWPLAGYVADRVVPGA